MTAAIAICFHILLLSMQSKLYLYFVTNRYQIVYRGMAYAYNQANVILGGALKCVTCKRGEYPPRGTSHLEHIPECPPENTTHRQKLITTCPEEGNFRCGKYSEHQKGMYVS